MTESEELLERAKKFHKEAIELRKKFEGLEEQRKKLNTSHKEFEKKFAEFTAYFEKESKRHE